MSRICVKNVPRYLSEERLREHFSRKGEVTDAKIIRTSDGRSRQFGFVGYRTEEEAQAAVKFFDRSFIDTARLTCEVAQPIGDPNLPRPWSRHSQGSSAYSKVHKAPESDEQPSAGRLETLETQGKVTSTENKGNDGPNDPQLLEFLQVMQPRIKTKLWANDTITANLQEETKKKHSNSDNVTRARSERKTKQVMSETVDNVVPTPSLGKGKSEGNSKSSRVHFEDEFEEDEFAANDETGSDEGGVIDSEIPVVKTDDLIGDETVSDLDYLKSKKRQNWSDDEEEIEMADSDDTSESDEEDEEERRSESPVPPNVTIKNNPKAEGRDTKKDVAAADKLHEDKNGSLDYNKGVLETNNMLSTDNSHAKQVVAEEQESVAETGRLFVRNLSYTTSEEDLVELFSNFGELSQVHLVLDKDTKRSKGLAYILYMLPEAAVRAMEALDKSIFQGRLIHILPAQRPPPAPEKDLKNPTGAPGISQFKQEREAQKRATESSGNTRAWNSLFMRPDTVAENVARKYGLSKSDFLDPEAEDLAVRMALGETHIIAETKKSLSDEGINVDILEDLASGKLDNIKRSNHVILVKNLPYMTTDIDLVNMFGKFGSLERMILPPTKTLALVVYLEASEARAAFKGLAYKRFKHVPLYLEWAPENILSGKSSREAGLSGKRSTTAIGEDQIKRVVIAQQLTGPTDEDIDSDSTESRSVFIKNLNFKTTEAALKKYFQQNIRQGALRSVTIKMKPSKTGKPLSMGFGFVEFDKTETAKDVCKQLQGTVLDGHALVLQLSHGRKEPTTAKALTSSGKPSNNESSTKMIVRNVAFEATKKDVRQLFSPFGQIKSLRLPKKFDGNHRGFAFVEFITKQEAENAYNALSSTHLYGRHLVLERAKEGESLEDLRARTATQFSEEVNQAHGSTRPSKKRKHNLLDDADMRFGQIAQ